MDYAEGKYFEQQLAQIHARIAYLDEKMSRLIDLLAEPPTEEEQKEEKDNGIRIKQPKAKETKVTQG